jgi:hypothetical protein
MTDHIAVIIQADYTHVYLLISCDEDVHSSHTTSYEQNSLLVNISCSLNHS